MSFVQQALTVAHAVFNGAVQGFNASNPYIIYNPQANNNSKSRRKVKLGIDINAPNSDPATAVTSLTIADTYAFSANKVPWNITKYGNPLTPGLLDTRQEAELNLYKFSSGASPSTHVLKVLSRPTMDDKGQITFIVTDVSNDTVDNLGAIDNASILVKIPYVATADDCKGYTQLEYASNTDLINRIKDAYTIASGWINQPGAWVAKDLESVTGMGYYSTQGLVYPYRSNTPASITYKNSPTSVNGFVLSPCVEIVPVV